MTTVTYTGGKRDDAFIPNRVASTTYVSHKVYPGLLAAGTPDSDDVIEVFDIPAKSRIVHASIRVSADIGESSSTVKLQANQNSVATDLTGTLSCESAGSTIMNVAPPAESAYVSTIQLAMGGGAITASATGYIETIIGYDMM